MQRCVAQLILLLLLAAPAWSATWVFDPGGNDTAAGSAAAPWRTWGKFVKAMSAGTIAAGDTVLWRPGRYNACEGLSWPFEPLQGGGATPITVKVDTAQVGNVEIHGGARPGICGRPAWTQARKCTTGSFIDAACDTSTECGGGTCSPMTGVWWTYSTTDSNGNFWGGVNAGVAYQPALTPGGAPKIYERLYAQQGSTIVKMPTFTAGRAQVMPYSVGPPDGGSWGAGNVCTGARNPFLCCTGSGTGTCDQSRIYVQTESGADPSTVGDASFGPVEFPYQPTVIWNDTSGLLRNLKFTNDNNGRLFFFRWGLTSIIMLKNADGITFEDFDFSYLSRSNALAHLGNTGSANASNFPVYNAGDSYTIYGWPSTGSNVVRNTTWRRCKIHGAQSNEQIHFIGGPVETHTNHTFEDCEIGDGSYAVPNGSSGTALTPNAYTNQVNKSWPPPGYSAWTKFTTHWGPLGGGGNTDGALISSANAHTFRRCYIHDTGLISFFESGGSGDLVFENNTLDLARHFYADRGGGGGFPNMLISYCGDPTNCGGLDGALALTVPVRFEHPGRKGAIIRNNVFQNCYSNVLRTGWFDNGDAEPTNLPTTPPQIVNNTFHIKGDFRSAAAAFGLPLIWIKGSMPHGLPVTGTGGTKLIFKNNILLRDTASTNSLPILAMDGGNETQVDLDYNNWGGINGIWRVGSTTYTSYASFRTAMQAIAAANESHSVNADPLFVTNYTNLSIQAGSPSYQTGLDLSGLGFSTDIAGTTRPAGLWSMGAYQGPASVTTTTTVTSTTGVSTTSVTSTTVVTTTSSTVTTTTLPGSVPACLSGPTQGSGSTVRTAAACWRNL